MVKEFPSQTHIEVSPLKDTDVDQFDSILMATSWGFYDHLTDQSHGFIENRYGEGRHAKTWSKALDK